MSYIEFMVFPFNSQANLWKSNFFIEIVQWIIRLPHFGTDQIG